MLIDANEVPEGAEREYDLCVIGGGAAGITLFRQLRRHPARKCLIESGGFEGNPRTQALYAGESTGSGYMGALYLTHSRLRYFGGSTNHWFSWCAPMDPEDFEARAWVPDSGWPISRADLEPYYPEAQRICGLGRFDYDVGGWPGVGGPTPAFSEGDFVSRMWQRNPEPVRFGERYREDVLGAKNGDTFLNANVTNLELASERDRILRVDVQTLQGRRFRVRAGSFVLACGGLENPRLLLASNGVAPAGVGNAHDRVGRFYMDHPHPKTIGTVLLRSVQDLRGLDLTPHPFEDGRVQVISNFGPSVGLQRRERLLSGNFALEREPVMQLGPAAAGVSEGFAYLTGASEADTKRANLVAIFEQAPNPRSRISLIERRDALGVPQIRFDWRFTDLDRESLLRTCRLLARDLGRTGLGRLQLAGWLRGGAPWPGTMVTGGSHHVGTTRMSQSPQHGVVDADCRVHGVRNLYVAGSSVFATSSRVNPTLTLVALTLRLAAHLEPRLS